MSDFLVLGLPRSRTAWLANFLTYDDITCSHEGLNGCHSLEQYKAKFKPNSGDSNTGLALFDFEELFRDFKIIVIDTDITAAVEFSKKYFADDSTEVMTRLKVRLDGLDGLHIKFSEINNNLDVIWDYVSDKPFNRERAEMLVGLDIQVRDIYDFDETAYLALKANTNDYFPPKIKDYVQSRTTEESLKYTH